MIHPLYVVPLSACAPALAPAPTYQEDAQSAAEYAGWKQNHPPPGGLGLGEVTWQRLNCLLTRKVTEESGVSSCGSKYPWAIDGYKKSRLQRDGRY